MRLHKLILYKFETNLLWSNRKVSSNRGRRPPKYSRTKKTKKWAPFHRRLKSKSAQVANETRILFWYRTLVGQQSPCRWAQSGWAEHWGCSTYPFPFPVCFIVWETCLLSMHTLLVQFHAYLCTNLLLFLCRNPFLFLCRTLFLCPCLKTIKTNGFSFLTFRSSRLLKNFIIIPLPFPLPFPASEMKKFKWERKIQKSRKGCNQVFGKRKIGSLHHCSYLFLQNQCGKQCISYSNDRLAETL